jgi:hypothetical protein
MFSGFEAITIEPSRRRTGPHKGTMSPPGLIAVAQMAEYISNPAAVSHKDSVSGFEVGFLGVRDDATLQEEAALLLSPKVGKRGKPIKILAYSYVFRIPSFGRAEPSTEKARVRWRAQFKAWLLTPEERAFIINQAIKRLKIKKGKYAWNLKRTGDHDCHLVGLNDSTDGRALQCMGSPGMRRKLVAIADTIHQALNLKRMREGRPTLMTMKEARSKNAGEMGYELLPDLLTRKALEEGLSGRDEILPRFQTWIETAGHIVDHSGKLQGRDYISVVLQGKAKAKRYVVEDLLKIVDRNLTKAISLDEGPSVLEEDIEI